MKYGIWCTRTSGSILGAAETWSKEFGQRREWATREEAQAKVDCWTRNLQTKNVSYEVRESHD